MTADQFSESECSIDGDPGLQNGVFTHFWLTRSSTGVAVEAMPTPSMLVASLASLALLCPLAHALPQVAAAHQELFAPGAIGGELFGASSVIDHGTAAVGASGAKSTAGNTGAVYLLAKAVDGTWATTQELTPPAGADTQAFGQSVDLDGDTLIIGGASVHASPLPLASSVEVYLYDRQPSGTWTLRTTLVVPSSLPSRNINAEVSVSGDLALVGLFLTGDNNFGHGQAFLYERSLAGTWALKQELLPSPPVMFYGAGVQLEGDMAAVSSPEEFVPPQSTGSVRVFRPSAGPGSSWTETAKLVGSDPLVPSVSFGLSISLSGNSLLVGSPGDIVSPQVRGRGYLFELQPGGAWLETAKMHTADPAGWTLGGSRVKLQADRAILSSSVDAYVFDRDAQGLWSEQIALEGSLSIFSALATFDESDFALGLPYDSTSAPQSGVVRFGELGELYHNGPEVSLATGGAQALYLRAGAPNAGKTYLLLGSLSGTFPGVTLAGAPPVHLALNPDFYTSALISSGGLGIVSPITATLDSAGAADASVSVPPLGPGLVGLVAHHAFVIVESSTITFASNAVPLRLLP